MRLLGFVTGTICVQDFYPLQSSFTQKWATQTSSFPAVQPAKPRRCDIYCRRGSKTRDRRFGDGRRPNRVSELVKREISAVIDDGYRRAFFSDKSQGPQLLSVVEVRCSDDLRHARVQVSVMGSKEQKENTMKWLRSARKEIRVELARRVYLKHTPELMFEESQIADAVNTMNILNKIAEENERKRELASVSQGSETKGIYESNPLDQDLELDASLDDAIIIDDMDDDDDSGLIVEVEDADEDEAGGHDSNGSSFRAQRNMRREGERTW
ncbi:ribosome-binding factor A [Gracilaria domingensis]|nr:ribosome-binding factor A [Gracilaria domingensis]